MCVLLMPQDAQLPALDELGEALARHRSGQAEMLREALDVASAWLRCSRRSSSAPGSSSSCRTGAGATFTDTSSTGAPLQGAFRHVGP